MTDPADGREPINADLIEPPRDGIAYVINIVGGDDRWMFLRAVSGEQQPDPACVSLVRRLALLAWATDLPEDRITVIPRRYDFGPDPYARYRSP